MRAALDLLAEAHRALRQEVAPSLDGDARYAALLAANAVATAQREVALCRRLIDAQAELPRDPAAFRSGAHDGDAALYARLLAVAVMRAHVADPAAVTEEERRAWLGEVEG